MQLKGGGEATQAPGFTPLEGGGDDAVGWRPAPGLKPTLPFTGGSPAPHLPAQRLGAGVRDEGREQGLLSQEAGRQKSAGVSPR